MYIYTKCNDNFKITVSLKSYEKVFCMSAPKSLFIFYNSFSLCSTENFHNLKHFNKTISTCFVYIIFL